MTLEYLKNNYASALNHLIYGSLIGIAATYIADFDTYNRVYNDQIFPMWHILCSAVCIIFGFLNGTFKKKNNDSSRMLNFIMLLLGIGFLPATMIFRLNIEYAVTSFSIMFFWALGWFIADKIKKSAGSNPNGKFFSWLFNLSDKKKPGIIILIVTIIIASIMEAESAGGDGFAALLLIIPAFYLLIWFVQWMTGLILNYISKERR